MKRYCKDIDITDISSVTSWVSLCLIGKTRRKDFNQMIDIYGGTVEGVAKEIISRINARDLHLKPIHYFDRKDGVNGKLRTLGEEEPIFQCMDYVAVNALMPLFKAKIGVYQCASIPNRGQIYGKHALEKWVNTDKKHSKYYIKVDVKQCYKSVKIDVVMEYLRRDVKNDLLLWFVEELLSMHKLGLSIGSYLSQYLCNYLLSYAYHHATESLHRIRHSKVVRLCYHVLFYMDDLIVIGSIKRDVQKSVELLSRYLEDKLGLLLKAGYQIYSVLQKPIDMMGYVIHLGYTTIRRHVYKRIRRSILRVSSVLSNSRHICLSLAQRLISYKGFLIHSDSLNVCKKYSIRGLFESALQTVRYYAKKKGDISYVNT